MYLDIVDRVNVLHGVLHYLPHLLESLERTKSRDGVPLHQDVALSQQFYGLQCGSIWTNQTLTSTYETLLVSNERFDLDDVTGYIILKYTSCLQLEMILIHVMNTKELLLHLLCLQNQQRNLPHSAINGLLAVSGLVKV